ncbi:TraC family protein [Rheinheimera sp.]|uniref:TraC family protein n=1 Tax=Rheinheimera sp. TaxID=1869214 RepID=UPI004048AA84
MSAYSKKIKKMLEHEPFHQLLPVVEYLKEDKVFILEEPAIAVMIICQPTAGCSDEIRNSFNTIYKSEYPEGATIQAQLVCTPDIEDFLYGYRAVRGNRMMNSDQEQCEALSDTIHDFFRKGTTEPINSSGFKFKNFEFWFTIKYPIKDAVPTKKEIEELQEMANQTFSRLSMFSPQIASDRDYFRRMRVLLNMFDEDGWRTKPQHMEKDFRTQPLTHLLLAPGKLVDVQYDGVSFRNHNDEEVMFAKPMSIMEMPENMFYGQMLNMVGDWQQGADGLFDPFMLTLNIIMPNQVKAKNAFFKKRTFITNQAQGALLKFVDKLGFQKEDYDAIDREISQENAKLIKYSMQLTIFSKNRKNALKFAERVTGFYSRLNVKILPDNHFALPFFLGALPFGLHKLFIQYSQRFQDGTSKLATFLTPHMASWKGNTPYSTFMLGSRLGQVVNLDFYDTSTNYNIYCAATSGAGKSFFTGYLVNNMLGAGIYKHPDPDRGSNEINSPNDGSQVFIVDVGRSYEGLAAQYENAKFLVFGRDFKYSMNPFPNVVDMYGQDGEANMIRTILKAMACPSGVVTDLQNAELLSVLQQVWEEKGNQATITDVANICLNHSEDEMVRFGKQLKPFTDDGVYGPFFSNKYPPVNYDSRLIVCELEELKSDPHLQVVVLMSLVVSIQKQMYLSGTDKRKLLIVDEGWQYLKDEGSEAAILRFFAEFLETGWRRFRKVNGAGALVTQSVMDAYESSAGRAIIANSSWLLLMRQNDEAIDKLESEKAYAGSPSDFSLLRSLKTVKPKPGISDEAYSEVFIRFEGQKQVCRLYTDRKLQLILTTQPDEKAIRQRYMDTGLTMVQAIEKMYEDEMANQNRFKAS